MRDFRDLSRRPTPLRPSPAAALLAVSVLTLLLLGSGCYQLGAPRQSGGPPRVWRMGFSAVPPRNDQDIAFAALQLWGLRADAAIFHVSPPWTLLLAGMPADSAVRSMHLVLAQYYHAKGMTIVVTVDPTNGLDRGREAQELTGLGRSLREPQIQALYRSFCVAMDTILRPAYLGLASEPNLIRLLASDSLYQAVRTSANAAAADVRAHDLSVQLFVSLQAEIVWGMPFGAGYQGVVRDQADFPFVQAFGLSSYPSLVGYHDPDELPTDYYARISQSAALPVLVVEGGWSSSTVGGAVSSPDLQARYIRRQMSLLDEASAVAAFQLMFTDLDSALVAADPGLSDFSHLGLVDSRLGAKPALAVWDSAFVRPVRENGGRAWPHGRRPGAFRPGP